MLMGELQVLLAALVKVHLPPVGSALAGQRD